MALVGEAHVVVRAITSSVEKDIRRSFSNMSGIGNRAGSDLGRSFSAGFNRNVNANTFSRAAAGIRTLAPAAESARRAFASMIRTSYTLGSALTSIVGGISAVIGGLGALGGAALGAMGSVAALGGVLAGVMGGFSVAKLALGGVGAAISAATRPATGGGGGGGGGGGRTAGSPGTADTGPTAAQVAANAAAREAAARRVQDAETALARVIERNREDMVEANNDVRDAQLELNEALKAGREEIQQLGFDAEDAALAEQKAALELGKAREALLRVQDLPPNSRARQEAELAFAEAELNLRKAKDRSADLNKEQNRLARTGVNGTEVVKNATDALARAEEARAKAARDAMRDEADAARDLIDAKNEAATAGQDNEGTPGTAGSGGTDIPGGGGGGGGGVDPYAGLNAAQEKFARFIVGLKPQFDELERIASESFLPPLQKAIEILMGAPFDRLKIGVAIIGSAMGAAAISIAEAINKGENLDDLSTIFETSGYVIEGLGRAIGSVWGSVVSILAAADPLTRRFVDYIESRAAAFDNFLNVKQASGELTNFFNMAGDAMADIGTIFDNVFNGIGDIIMANLGPGTGGQYMLDWLIRATDSFANMDQTGLREYFLGVSVNATKVGSSIGALIGELIALGDNSAIGETFDILKTGAPALGNIIEKTIEAGPAFARLVVAVTQIIDKLTDTGAIEIFFGTLATMAEFVNDLLSNKIVQAILDVTGRIFAFLSALGLVYNLGRLAFNIMLGALAPFLAGLGSVVGAIGAVISTLAGASSIGAAISQMFAFMTYSANPFVALLGRLPLLFTALTGPVGIVIGLIAALVGGFIYLYNTSDTFRAQMDGIFAQLVSVFMTLASTIMDAVMPLIPVVLGAFSSIVGAIMPLIPLLLNALIPAFTSILSAVIPVVAMLIGTLVPVFVQIVAAIIPLVTTIISTLVPVFAALIEAIVPIVAIIIGTLVPIFAMLITAIMPVVTTIISLLVPVLQFVVTVLTTVVTAIVGLLLPAFTWIIEAFTNVATFLTPLAQLFSDIWGAIVDTVSRNIAIVVDFVTTGLGILFSTWGEIWTAITTFLSETWDNIVLFVATYVNILMTVVTTVITTIQNTWNTIWGAISTFFSAIWTAIVGFVTTYIDTVRTIIDNVLKIINAIWTGQWDQIGKYLENIWDAIKKYVDVAIKTVRDVITAVINVISTVWNAIWDGIGKTISTIWDGIMKAIENAINFVRDIITSVITAISSIWSSIWNGISTNFHNIWNSIIAAVQSFKTFFHDAFNGIAGFVSTAFNGVLGAVKGPINGIIGLVNQAIGALNGLSVSIPAWVPLVGGQTWGLNLPKIPRLAKGGTAMPSPGGTLAVIAEAGRPERVEPLDKDGLSQRDRALITLLAGDREKLPSIQITVMPSEGMDEAELAAMIGRELAYQLRKGGF